MRSRKFLLAGAAVILGCAGALLVAELAARVAGYKPRIPAGVAQAQMYRPDPVLMWRLRPGHYLIPPSAPEGEVTTVTIRPDGARMSGPVVSGRPQLLLIGCSFTMGQAVSDQDTWAWRLQGRQPGVEVLNYGHSGYGGVQSLLLLRQLLADGQRPAWVIYGDIGHEARNIAAPSWLRMLVTNSAQPVEIPYATLAADGDVELHAPIGWPSVPLHEYLALAALLEQVIAQSRPLPSVDESRRITEGLIMEMAATARQYGARFTYLMLFLSDEDAWTRQEFARAHGVDLIDCREPIYPEDNVPGEGHPNAGVHARWGDCIAAAMSSRMPQNPPAP